MDSTIEKESIKLDIKDTPINKLYSYPKSLGHWKGYIAEHLTSQTKYNINTLPTVISPTTYVGIEVEVENIEKYSANTYAWQLHEDSSLRNNGKEFVTVPLRGSQIPLALTLLFNDILYKGYDFSKRTSVHIHLDVRGFTPSQIAAYICIFTVFEKILYKFIGHGRDKNIFCVPLQQTLISNALLEAVNSGFKQHRWYKYAGLNILPIQNQGSIELRQLYGTDDVQLIINWLNLLLRIRIYAEEVNLDDILMEIKSLNTNSQYDFFTTKIFGIDARLLDLTTLVSDMESGVICVKQCTLNNQFHKGILLSLNPKSPLIKRLISIVPKQSNASYALDSGIRDIYDAAMLQTIPRVGQWSIAPLQVSELPATTRIGL